MRVGEFILSKQDELDRAWAEFARSIKPGTELALQDRVGVLLAALVSAIETAQTEQERPEMSVRWRHSDRDIGHLQTSNLRAIDRAAQKYSVTELMSAFRALRASVTKLGIAYLDGRLAQQDVEEVVRFNAAVDKLLAESLGRFARDVQGSRDLLLAIRGHDLRNPLCAIKNYTAVLGHAPNMSTDKRLPRRPAC